MYGIPLKYILIAVAVAGLCGWVARVDHLRAHWHDKYDVLATATGELLGDIRKASNNPTLKLKEAGDQVRIIAASRLAWKGTAELQSSRIEEMANETMRLKALSAQRRKQAETAIAKRETAIERLKTQAMTAADRSDCAKQIKEANDALDLVYSEGL